MTTRVRALLVLLCLVAACGSGGRAGDEVASTLLTPEQSAASDAAVANDAADGTLDGDADQGAPGADGGTQTQTQPPDAAVAPLPTPRGAGSFAGFYLRPRESASIVLAVGAQSGAAPTSATLDHLVGVLRQVSSKPVRTQMTTLPAGARSWTAADLVRTAEQTSPQQSRDAAVMTVLFLHGDYDGDSSVLGIAARSDVAAVFADQVAGSAGLLGSAAAVERSVSTHEVGHLLGLVDLFLDTGRQDREHPGHSTSAASVMYWAVESDLIGAILGANPPTEFDAADLADLAAIRNS